MPTAIVTVVGINVIENGDFLGAEWDLDVFVNGRLIRWTQRDVQDNTNYVINMSLRQPVLVCNQLLTITFGGREEDAPPFDPHDPLPVGVTLQPANVGLRRFRLRNRNASYVITLRFTCVGERFCLLLRDFIANTISLLSQLTEKGMAKLGLEGKEQIDTLIANAATDEGETAILQAGLNIMAEKGLRPITMNDKHIIFDSDGGACGGVDVSGVSDETIEDLSS